MNAVEDSLVKKAFSTKQPIACQSCSTTGQLENFYTKKFCSEACAKDKKKGRAKPVATIPEDAGLKLSTLKLGPFQCVSGPPKERSEMQEDKTTKNNLLKEKNNLQKEKAQKAAAMAVDKQSNQWKAYVSHEDVIGAPISAFNHCPFASVFDTELKNLTFLITNRDDKVETDQSEYFYATVMKMTGYRAKLRYMGCGNDSSHDVWHNVCSPSVHNILWACNNQRPVAPPPHLAKHRKEWKKFIMLTLSHASTLPLDLAPLLPIVLNSYALKVGTIVEVADKMGLCTNRVAVVEKNIGGRLTLQYMDYESDEDQFVCHEHSSLLHPVGWSQAVGHQLKASEKYKAETKNLGIFEVPNEKYSTAAMFPNVPKVPVTFDADGKVQRFEVGMMLEVIDPLKLCNISVGCVDAVLGDNFLMIKIMVNGVYADLNRVSNLICHHATSPYILPMGFCHRHNIPLTNPNLPDSELSQSEFSWKDYLVASQARAAPCELFCSEVPDHQFEVGMKLEAVDLMQPDLICIATVSAIAGRLLLIHFDGWDDTFDQWMDCRSPDIYPIGWCEIVGHIVQQPKSDDAEEQKKKLKNQKSKAKKRNKKKKEMAENQAGSVKGSVQTNNNCTGVLPDDSSIHGNSDTPAVHSEMSNDSAWSVPVSTIAYEPNVLSCDVTQMDQLNLNSSNEEMPTLSPVLVGADQPGSSDIHNMSTEDQPEELVAYTY